MKLFSKIKSFLFPTIKYFKKTEIEYLEQAINKYNKQLNKLMSKCDCGMNNKRSCNSCQSYSLGYGWKLREKIDRIAKQLVILRAREKAKDE